METGEGNDGVKNPLTLVEKATALEATRKALKAEGIKGIKRKTSRIPPPKHFDNSPTRPPKRAPLEKLTLEKIRHSQFKK